MPPGLWLAALCAGCDGRTVPVQDAHLDETLDEKDQRVFCQKDAECGPASPFSYCMEQPPPGLRIRCRRTDEEILSCLDRIAAMSCHEILHISMGSCIPMYKSVDGCKSP